MKKIFTILALGLATIASAQSGGSACTPDPAYTLASGAGVFPLPDTNVVTIPFAYVCQGEPFSFTFTAVVPDSISLNGARIDLTRIAVTSISGLPAGITSACYSPQGQGATDTDANDCSFPDRAIGCAILTGTTTAAAGNYDIVINAQVNGLFSIPFGAAGSPVPGKYRLVVEAAGSCTAAVEAIGGGVSVNDAQPNPAADFTNFTVNAEQASTLSINVINSLGQMVSNQVQNITAGENTLRVETSNLANGIYFVAISNGTGVVTKRMMVQH